METSGHMVSRPEGQWLGAKNFTSRTTIPLPPSGPLPTHHCKMPFEHIYSDRIDTVTHDGYEPRRLDPSPTTTPRAARAQGNLDYLGRLRKLGKGRDVTQRRTDQSHEWAPRTQPRHLRSHAAITPRSGWVSQVGLFEVSPQQHVRINHLPSSTCLTAL